jgi:hypothetical protein
MSKEDQTFVMKVFSTEEEFFFFNNEAEAAQKLKHAHQNIIKTLEIGMLN